MNDTIKHAAGTVVSGLGFVGSITLSQASDLASLVCAIVGIVAGACTIHSWWSKRHESKNHHRHR
jgi:hypothetical protein